MTTSTMKLPMKVTFVLSHLCERDRRQTTLGKVMVVILLCFIISMYAIFVLAKDSSIQHTPWYVRSAPCVTPQVVMDQMIKLTFATSSLLTKLNISHVICYGTLWGALRHGKTLPWDNNVDFCVLKNEIDKVPLVNLQSEFSADDMHLSYDQHRGEYTITQGPAHAIITVFYVTHFEKVYLYGLEYRLGWFFYRKKVSFPSTIMESPFATVEFHGRQVPVPHDGFEILKYLYPDDWWIIRPPAGCSA